MWLKRRGAPQMRCARFVTGFFGLVAFAFTTVALAADAAPDAETIVRSLHPLTGKIGIAKGIAELNLGENFRYLDQKDASTYLTKVLGNPPSAVEGIDGMIIPTTDGQNWFAVVSYSDEGHVSDSDASTINYDDLLKEMQAGTVEDSKERKALGFKGLELVGWAQKPYYDAAAKKLYWAKSVRFEGEQDLTLNYDVRILGREGFVNLNIVDSIDQLEKINAQMPGILSMVNFTKNNTYAEYVQSTDRTAAYGIAGLIAGGVLAKVGFFKGLMVMLAASWKLIGVALVAAGAAVSRFIKGIFGRKVEE